MKYAEKDRWDVREMQDDWLRCFTSIRYEYAVQVAEEILSLAPTQSALVRFRQAPSASVAVPREPVSEQASNLCAPEITGPLNTDTEREGAQRFKGYDRHHRRESVPR